MACRACVTGWCKDVADEPPSELRKVLVVVTLHSLHCHLQYRLIRMYAFLKYLPFHSKEEHPKDAANSVHTGVLNIQFKKKIILKSNYLGPF